MQTANDATTYCLSRNAPTRRAKRWNVEKNASEVCNDEKVHVSPQVHNQRSTPNDQQNKTERSTFRSKKIVDVDKEECGIHFYEEIESNPITNDALPNFLPPVPALPLIRPMKLFPPDRTFQPKYAYHRYQQYWKDKQYLIEKMTNNGNGCDKR
ncbi:hypothetical protein Tcan_05601 [Toxocara canis]|uniref:Uncharacterized protein n=1 Tax=Toxocara canis TaxID=6265 RepID=A0A0B2V3Z3_TOXCA|nr:hypothetical protein Tcan_05601 [Toxocara canis]